MEMQGREEMELGLHRCQSYQMACLCFRHSSPRVKRLSTHQTLINNNQILIQKERSARQTLMNKLGKILSVFKTSRLMG